MRDINYKQKFSAGNLVKLDFVPEEKQELDFVTCTHYGNKIVLFERIDLASFPSHNDFFGKSIAVPRGTLAIVLEPRTIPDSIGCYLALRPLPAEDDHRLIRNDLTVYDILVKGRKYQAFGCDMMLKRED